MIPLMYRGIENSQTHGRREEIGGCQGLEGGRDGELLFRGYKVSVIMMNKF